MLARGLLRSLLTPWTRTVDDDEQALAQGDEGDADELAQGGEGATQKSWPWKAT